MPEAPSSPAPAAPAAPAAPPAPTGEPGGSPSADIPPIDPAGLPTPEPGSDKAGGGQAPAAPSSSNGPPAPAGEPGQPAPAEGGQPPPSDPYAELVLPEDATVDQAVLDEVKAHAAERGWSVEEARADLDRQVARQQKVAAAYDAEVDGWREQLVAELGPKFGEADQVVSAFLAQHAGQEFIDTLRESGFAYYRPLFDLFHRLATQSSEPRNQAHGNPTPNRPMNDQELWTHQNPNSGPMPGAR